MDINWQKHGTEALSYLKGIGNKVKQVALQLTEIEVKVEDATNNEPWGPHGKDMAEITKASYELENYKQIMGVIARRLQDQAEDWRHVYKSLLLLEYMSKHGPQKVVEEIVSNVGVIEKLTNFQHKDANGKDWGLNVRQRAKELIALVTDAERVRSERHKAKANASKYTGVSSDDLKSGGFGAKASGFGSSAAATFGLPRKYSGGLGSSGLGSTGGFGSGSRSGSYHDYDEPYDSDPKEATRERIERLKKEGAVEFEEGSGDKGAIPPPKVPVLKQGRAAVSEAKAEELKGPKKLSEFKVNPSIAATLGQLPASGALQPPQAKAASNGTIPAVHAEAATPADLLLELDATAAAAPAPSGGQDDWDAFAGGESAAASKPAAHDDWMSGFSASSNGAGSTLASSDPFGQLAAPPSTAPAPRHPTAADPFAQLSAPGPSAAPAQQPSADPFADPFSATTSASGHPSAAPKAAPPPLALSDDFFSMPAQPGPSMGGMQGHMGSSSAGDFGMFGGQPQAAPQPQAQGSFGAMQQSSGGFGSFTQPFPAPSALGSSTVPSTSKPATAQGNSFSHGPLNPAAPQSLGGPTKSKDPFADLASLGSAF